MQPFRRLLQQQGDIGGATRSLEPDGRANGAISLVGQQEEAEPLRYEECEQQQRQKLPPDRPGKKAHGSSLTSAARL